jgi:hypothetical protein
VKASWGWNTGKEGLNGAKVIPKQVKEPHRAGSSRWMGHWRPTPASLKKALLKFSLVDFYK